MEDAGVRQTHLFTRLLVLLLAVAAAVVVALPSHTAWPQEVLNAEEPWTHLGQGVLNLAAWASCALAAVLAWRSAEHPAALPLALFLSLFALAYGISSAPPVVWQVEAFSDTRPRHLLGYALLLLTSWAFFDFSTKFPEPLRADRLRAAAEKRDALTARERIGISLLIRNKPESWGRTIGTVAFLQRRWLRLSGFGWFVGVWLLLALVLTASGHLKFFEVRSATAGLFLGLLMLSFLLTSMILPMRYVVAGRRDRRRLLWITFGFGALWYFLMAAYFIELWLFKRDGLDPTTFGVGWLVLVAALAIAVFKDGVFDPALIIRKSALYGALLPILAVVFAGVENLVSDYLAERVGLTSSIAPWVGALVAVLLFGPLRNRISKFTERLFRGTPDASPKDSGSDDY